ncbi:hypothetical protein [Actinophytocola glycyrrhizae]|uniref:Uncharacterized protein n=1 Tax=Actinophytocola glycyrrhizae TaxID=2044873 RepID=A0ABV9S072_9PSEU
MSAFAMVLGPWVAVAGLGLFLTWIVIVVREFTRGHLARSGRPFTARLWGITIEVGAGDPGRTEADRT